MAQTLAMTALTNATALLKIIVKLLLKFVKLTSFCNGVYEVRILQNFLVSEIQILEFMKKNAVYGKFSLFAILLPLNT